MTATTLDALLYADLTDAANRAILSDALRDAGRETEADLLQSGGDGAFFVRRGKVNTSLPGTFGELLGRIGLDSQDWTDYCEVVLARRQAEAKRRGRPAPSRHDVNPSAPEALAWVLAGRPNRKMTAREALAAVASHYANP